MDRFTLNFSAPPKSSLPGFEHIWYALDVRKRVMFLEKVIRTIEWSAERLNARLSSLGPTETLNLARKLKWCSTIVFMKYIKILAVGQTNAVRDRSLLFVASNLYTPTTTETVSKAVPFQPCDESTSASAAFPHSSEQTLKPADSRLRELAHSLPPELFSNMLQIFLHTVFGPRKIYLGVEHLNLHVLRALDRAMYAKQQSILLSDSAWVIGQGNYEETIGFLNRMPKPILRRIKKIELRLTSQDCKYPSLEHYFALPLDAAAGTNRLDYLLEYMEECAKTRDKLMTIWCAKINAVMELKLSELVLDFTDAYGPDGEFLGRRFARSAPNFSGVKFTVLGMEDR